MSPEEVVQAQFEAYNAQDVDALCACYTPDCISATFNGPITYEGIDALRTRHEELFATFPKNVARLVNRIVVSDGVVVDHEQVERAPGGERFEVAAIYTFRDGLIARVDFARSRMMRG